VESLRDRVDDWKGHDVAKFGHLILQDVFLIQKGGIDREYHVFLFENILVCGRHIPTINRKPFKISSLFKKRSQDGGSPAIEDPPLQLKGRIFMSSIISVVPTRACAGDIAFLHCPPG
jgi:cell division control protein 24